MNYQEIVNACKKAYADKDMNKALEYWEKMYDLLDEKKSKFDKTDEKNIYACFSEFDKSNKKMKYLDDFISFYEWCILESEDTKGLYNIYDLQTNEIIDEDENNGNKTKVETILRLVDKALDYELDEVEYETDEDYENALNSRYIKGLISIQDEFIKKRTKELEKEIEYEERKLKYCAYGKSDLYHIEDLKWKLVKLGDR